MGFFSVGGSKAKEILPGVSQRVLCGSEGKLMLVWYEFDAGAALPVHAHPHEQAGVMIEGEADFSLGDERRRVRKGDGWHIPGGVEHGATFTKASVVLETFHPPREDFLR